MKFKFIEVKANMEAVEIVCRCKECYHFEKCDEGVGYCHFWNYEPGNSPNVTTALDFCSNAQQK